MHFRYRIDTLVGQGGMGFVQRAYDRLTRTWVALKQLFLEDYEADNPENTAFRTALAEEFRLLATLRHPNIVSVLDYGFLEQTTFFTMEFLEGAQPIAQAAQTQSVTTRLQWIVQLLQALEYLRRRQVIHRDLKPANVLVLQDQVKVLDFGLAVLEGQASTTAGSIYYMAPEVLTYQPATHATDLFSVGVMAYELLAGKRPFDAFSLDELMHRICTAEPDYARLAGPPTVHPILARLLAKDPTARFATAGEALTELINAMSAATDATTFVPETQAIRASFIQAAQFVGRAAEHAQLVAALEHTLAGQGSTWLLGGESGVGKSRLLEELRIQALVQGAYVWHGQAVSEGGQPAQLWRAILPWLLLVTNPTDLEASVLKPYVPQIEELLERPVADAPALDAGPTQIRFCATVVALLRRATAEQPLVLVLEDLHWAGPLSLTVLTWINRVAPDLRLLILATYRDDERPKLPEQLPQMAMLRLRRLDLAQVTTLASAILGLPTHHLAQLADFLYRETEGNAFFLVEVLRSLAEEAGLLSQITHMVLPAHITVGGIQQVVQRRLQQVAAADRPYLTLAAIHGRQLDIAVLRHLAPNLSLAAWLSRCAEAAVLEPVGANWQFAHDQLRAGVLAAVPPAHQRDLHQAVAEALEQVYQADLTPHLEQLVHHYAQTPHTAKHRHYLERAGHAALAMYAHAEAAQYFSQALELTPASAPRYALLLAREQAYHMLGARTAQAQDLQALTQLVPALADPAQALQIALRWSAYHIVTSDYPAAFATAQQAVALAQAQGEAALQAMAQFRWGWALWLHADYAAARARLETALALARATHNIEIEIDSLHHLGQTVWRQNQLALAQQFITQSMQLAQAHQDRYRESEALGALASVTMLLGNHTAALRYYAQALTLARTLGHRLAEAFALNDVGMLHLYEGNYAQAQSCLEQNARLFAEIEHRQGCVVSFINLGHVHRYQGDFQLAQAYYEQSLTQAQTLGIVAEQGYALTGLGHVWVALNQGPAAVAAFEKAITLRQELQLSNLIVESRAGLAWAWLAQGQLALALAQVEQILDQLTALVNVEEPFLIYLICYRVLQAADDARAPGLLTEAHTKLQAQAAQLEAPQQRTFLENVPWHREIISALTQLAAQPPYARALSVS